jgi:hypothetical protein
MSPECQRVKPTRLGLGSCCRSTRRGWRNGNRLARASAYKNTEDLPSAQYIWGNFGRLLTERQSARRSSLAAFATSSTIFRGLVTKLGLLAAEWRRRRAIDSRSIHAAARAIAASAQR